MNEQRHIIEKVFVEIDTTDELAAYRLKDTIGDILAQKVFPALENLFDQYSCASLITRFDRLEIEVSLKEISNLNMLRSGIVNSLSQKVEKAVFAGGLSGNGTKISAGSLLTGDAENNGHQQISSDGNLQAVFLFFLENGFLPWHADKKQAIRIFTPETWADQLKSETFLSKLTHLIGNSENALQRYLYQVPVPNILQLISKLGKVNFNNVTAFEKYLDTVSHIHRYQWLKVLLKISLAISKKEWQQYWNDLLLQHLTEDKLDKKNITRKLATTEKSIKKFFTERTIQNYFALNAKQEEFLMMFGGHRSAEHAERGHTQKGSIAENNPTIISHGSNVELEKEPLFFETDAGEIAVQNAGQVLFSPFLPALFRSLNWLDKQQKIKKEHQFKALQTLHFCVTGKEDFFEADLILEKFLCGAPLKTVVPSYSLLNDDIKREADKMLQELIKNWAALKNTSPDSLRQLFIQRDGKLIKRNQGFKLIVERKAQDVLLEELPWGISIVKLPWIKELLFVEW